MCFGKKKEETSASGADAQAIENSKKGRGEPTLSAKDRQDVSPIHD